ncbi:hypothetical protein [Sediminibacterium ginsengisoli]|uniref:Uncharacterized protein n=1 Tax=Sediminibacterium ginsengisoli TaxID=413434 RepID=A0A1T4LEC0_9BACT|nr:hypothetical protein [Sediminibacterium ginsengisoli]SJZ52908.1 hypothetical protein SAMN04488132_102455 [Sediminibacterium ginsengisoli]
MKGLSFFSRFAFICNLFFLVCVIIQRIHFANGSPGFAGQQEISGIVIVLGWFVSPFLNLGVNTSYAILLINRKPFRLPRWLAFANLFFLILQFFIYFILPA